MRQASRLLRAHGPEGALRTAQAELDFAVLYGAPGEAEHWQAVMLTLMKRV